MEGTDRTGAGHLVWKCVLTLATRRLRVALTRLPWERGALFGWLKRDDRDQRGQNVPPSETESRCKMGCQKDLLDPGRSFQFYQEMALV